MSSSNGAMSSSSARLSSGARSSNGARPSNGAMSSDSAIATNIMSNAMNVTNVTTNIRQRDVVETVYSILLHRYIINTRVTKGLACD